MIEFQEKRKIKRWLYSKITLFFLIIFLVILLNSLWEVYNKQEIAKNNLAKTAASLESLRGREKMLSSEIERLKTEDGTEAEVREKYGLVKPGEEVIVLSGQEESKSINSPSTQSDIWQKIFDWFK